jgi:hypothetical protein
MTIFIVMQIYFNKNDYDFSRNIITFCFNANYIHKCWEYFVFCTKINNPIRNKKTYYFITDNFRTGTDGSPFLWSETQPPHVKIEKG